jgi:hypothetical protein
MLSSRPGMPRYAAIGLVALSVGCLGPKSQQCESDGASWVCPEALACAAPPTYCANPLEVGACDNQPDGAPCRTAIVSDGLCVDNACQPCAPDIEGCRSLGWNSMTVPSGTYKVVYGAGSGDAWAGGTLLAHYDGAHWETDTTLPTLMGGATIDGLSGTSSAHLFAATSTETVYHQAAGAWVTTTTAAIPKAIWAAGDDEAFTVGLSGDVEHFDGSAWTPMANTMTTASLGAVWGSSPTDVYAVGTVGTLIHYNGAAWTVSTVGTGTLAAVWGSGPNDIYVGGTGGIWHSVDGTTWTPEDTTDSIDAIWGSSATDVFAGTKTDMAIGIVRSDGTGLWVPLVSPTMVTGIGGSGPMDVFAASGTNVYRYTGAAWSSPLVGTPSPSFASAWAVSPTALFACGDAGEIDQFDGTTWETGSAGTALPSWLNVWARAANDAYAVSGSQIVHWDGATWTSDMNPGNDPLEAVSGTASTTYIVSDFLDTDSGGTVSRVSGEINGANPENAIWIAPDDGTVFVAGDALYALHGATIDTLLPGGGWTALWGTSSSDVFAAGKGGVIRHFDGTSWSDPMDTGTIADLTGLWGTSDDDVFASGTSATLLHYHAQLWTIVPPPTNVTAAFNSVTGAGSTIFVVGPGGTAARLIESAP